ncbi:hypothetical protein NPIL_35311 [Nephila pilipes]|uniref:Uncharacterized protein n=1 Tax=Nephila pilipes TaxID=299642 RepID=A0A8X6UC66_NEPPI|nr:hypothetical protein NPIL_35311 [Nephila pilipes]
MRQEKVVRLPSTLGLRVRCTSFLFLKKGDYSNMFVNNASVITGGTSRSVLFQKNGKKKKETPVAGGHSESNELRMESTRNCQVLSRRRINNLN